jgi:biopolymer transport protein ExbB/TolQ
MTVGVVILVLITSAGIFGYLSNAYQGATLGFEKQSTELIALEDRLEQLEEDKVFLKEELEAQVNDLPENYRTARRQLRESYNPQIQKVNQDILDIKGKMSDLELNLIETGVDVGPAIYLARAFDTEIDTVVKFFIFVLIFVFDPLALSLVLAFNHMIEREEREKDSIEKMYDMYSKKKFKRDVKKEKIDVDKKKVVKKIPKQEIKSRGGIKIT